VAAAGRIAIAEAERLWRADIYDPKRTEVHPHANASRNYIDSMLRACGWTWEIPYKGDGQVEWCGIFAGACWVKAGLKPEIAKTFFPSTYRLNVWGHYRPFDDKHKNPKPKAPPYRLIAEFDEHSTVVPWQPQKGDILVIGNKGEGQHITLVDSYDHLTRTFTTYEGNGVGLGPDGKKRQGVVTSARHLGGTGYCARRLIRPAPSDLLGG
jgi:hypothetical protein